MMNEFIQGSETNEEDVFNYMENHKVLPKGQR